MIKIERLTNDIEKEVDRLSDGPTTADFLKFDAILVRQFQATQRVIHVVTRSLKSSGKINSSTTENSWKGEISYGGQSEGIHNPVDYAEFERERDGAHDFLAPAISTSDDYIAAITAFLEG